MGAEVPDTEAPGCDIMGIRDERGGGKLCLAIVAVAVILLSSFAVFTEDSNADPITYGYVKVKAGGSYVQNESGSEDFGTMVAALTRANSIDTSQEVIIECQPGMPINFFSAHDSFVKRSVTIEGNDAYVMTGTTLGGDFAIENATGRELCADTDLIINSLHCVTVWGDNRRTTHTLTIEMNNCNSYVPGYPNSDDKAAESGVMMRSNTPNSDAKLVMTINGCKFNKGIGTGSVIHTTYNCSLHVTDCEFIGVPEPINLNTKTENIDVSAVIEKSTFTDCGAGTTASQKQYSAPIRVVNSKSSSESSYVLVDDCTFTNSDDKKSSNGHILIGDGRANKSSHQVSLVVKNTDAEIWWQSPNYYTNSTNSTETDKSKIITQSVSKDDLVVTSGVSTLCTVEVCSGGGGSVPIDKLYVSSGTSVSSSGNILRIGSQTISATANTGYIFSEWTVPSDGAITEDIKTITAKFTQSSSGTVVTTSDNTETTVTKTGNTATVVTEIKISGGTTMDEAIQEAVEQIVATERAAGATDVVKQVVIPATKEVEASAASVEVSATSIKAIKDSGADLAVKTEAATVAIKTEALNTLSDKDKTIKVVVDPNSTLNASQQAEVGSNQYIDVTAFVGDEQVHELGGSAVITVPCTISGNVKVSYVDDYGNVSDIPCTYSGGYVTFTTTHFSIFMVSEVPSSTPSFIPVPDNGDDFPGYVPTQKTDSASDDSAKIAVLVGAIVVVLVAIVALVHRSR